jgi:predicted nucleotidyltransferase
VAYCGGGGSVTTLNPIINSVTQELSRNARGILGDRLRKIILYGSYARGDYEEYSDLDIMVLADFEKGEEKALETKLGRISSRVSLDYDITVSLLLNNETLFMSRLHISPFYRNILSEGVEIYAAH